MSVSSLIPVSVADNYLIVSPPTCLLPTHKNIKTQLKDYWRNIMQYPSQINCGFSNRIFRR